MYYVLLLVNSPKFLLLPRHWHLQSFPLLPQHQLVVHHPFPYENWQNWGVFPIVHTHTHTHISASKLTHLWKTYENIWTHLKNCGLSPIFHPLPHHSNLLTAAVRLNVTSQVCRKSFRPLVFWWSSPFPAEGLMFDDVWLFDSNENMKTLKRQEPGAI